MSLGVKEMTKTKTKIKTKIVLGGNPISPWISLWFPAGPD
jgi:hypothetical protein